MSFIAPNAHNSTSVKLDAPGTPTSKNTLRTLNTGDKLVANHFNQTDHTIDNIRV